MFFKGFIAGIGAGGVVFGAKLIFGALNNFMDNKICELMASVASQNEEE